MLLSKRGFYHPIAILILAAITLSVAVIIYINSNILFKQKPSPTPQASPVAAQEIPKPSPKVKYKTYTHQNEKFSIDYPEDFTFKEGESQVLFTKGIAQYSVSWSTSEIKSVSEIEGVYNSSVKKIGNRDVFVAFDDVARDNVGNSYVLISQGKKWEVTFSANLEEEQVVSSLKFLN